MKVSAQNINKQSPTNLIGLSSNNIGGWSVSQDPHHVNVGRLHMIPTQKACTVSSYAVSITKMS